MCLNTDRLFLREATESDIASLRAYQSDGRYLEHYEKRPDASSIIQQALGWANESPRENYQYIVELDSSEVIGCAGLRTKGCESRTGEIGIEIDPNHWGNGFAHEVLEVLIESAKSLELRILRAETNRKNIRAQNLMRSHSFSIVEHKGNSIVMYREIQDNA